MSEEAVYEVIIHINGNIIFSELTDEHSVGTLVASFSDAIQGGTALAWTSDDGTSLLIGHNAITNASVAIHPMEPED